LLLAAGFAVAAVQKKQQPVSKRPASKKSTTSKKTASPKKSTPPAKTVARRTTAKTVTPKKTSKRAGTRRVARRRSSPSWRRGQQEPTPDRYREIQQALIDRGYLQSPVPEKWGTESVDALKRFQQDQKLEASGKLDSLSIIALGLGPKRDLASQNGRIPLAQPPPEEDR
jgi:hypothetical protein